MSNPQAYPVWGGAILSAVPLENRASPRDLLTTSQHVAVACLDPDGASLTVVV